MSDRPGDRLGDDPPWSRGTSDALPAVEGFRVGSEIGRGGFSVVYEATQLGLERQVALKVINATGNEARRFEREARALGALSGIQFLVQAFAVTVTDDGRPVLVMPLMADTVARRIASGGRCDPAEVARWAVQLAGALDEAHHRGVSHRDVKPENVLLSASGDAYLADLGIAALDGVASSTTISSSISPPHAPPERFSGQETDPRAGDIYSLASTLYAALAGAPPFGTDLRGGPLGLMNRVANEPPPMIPSLPAAANTALRHGLAKSPADRPVSAAVLAEELRRALEAPDVISTIPPVFAFPPLTGTTVEDPVERVPATVMRAVPPTGASWAEADAGERAPLPPAAQDDTGLPVVVWVLGGVLLGVTIGIVWFLGVRQGRTTSNPSGIAREESPVSVTATMSTSAPSSTTSSTTPVMPTTPVVTEVPPSSKPNVASAAPPAGCVDPGSAYWPGTTVGPVVDCPSYPFGAPDVQLTALVGPYVAVLYSVNLPDVAEARDRLASFSDLSPKPVVADSRRYPGLRDPYLVILVDGFASTADASRFCAENRKGRSCYPRAIFDSSTLR